MSKPTRRQTEKVREMIKAQAIRDRLQSFALDEPDPRTGKPVEMNTAQVKAALSLLGKVVPDLQSIDSTVTNRDEPKDEAQLKAELSELLKTLKPEELAQLMQTDKEGESAADLH